MNKIAAACLSKVLGSFAPGGGQAQTPPSSYDKAQYDVVIIAAAANDIPMLELALALIAAVHLGHAEVVNRLLAWGSNVDHVNNFGLTALLEAIIFGDGSPEYVRDGELGAGSPSHSKA